VNQYLYFQHPLITDEATGQSEVKANQASLNEMKWSPDEAVPCVDRRLK